MYFILFNQGQLNRKKLFLKKASFSSEDLLGAFSERSVSVETGHIGAHVVRSMHT